MSRTNAPSTGTTKTAEHSHLSKTTRGPRVAAAAVLLLSVFNCDGLVGEKIHSYLAESARADAYRTIEECRDLVRCHLTDISMRHVNQVERGIDHLNYKKVGKVQLGEYECTIGQTKEGFLIAIGDDIYLVGKTEKELHSAIEEVKSKINRVSDARGNISGALAENTIKQK